MITKKTIIDRTEILNDGTVQIRLSKQIVDGETVLMSEPHRTVITPGANLDDQMAAVNAHLLMLGWPVCDDYSEIKKYVEIAQTPEKIARHAALIAENETKIKSAIRN